MTGPTPIAIKAFGSFRHDTERLEQRDMRAVALAGHLGQNVQAIAHQTTEHLFVADGDLEAQDDVMRQAGELAAQGKADLQALMPLVAHTSAERPARAYLGHVVASASRTSTS